MAVPNLWRTQKQRYSLQAEICPHCSNAVFPPRKVCPYCKRPATQTIAPKSDAVLFVYPLQAPISAGVAVTGDD